jgi:hypothetical protein
VKRRLNPQRVLHNIKFYAVEVSATIVFLVWLARAVWHELGLK